MVNDRSGPDLLTGRYDFHYLENEVQDRFARVIDMTLLETSGSRPEWGKSRSHQGARARTGRVRRPFDAWVIERRTADGELTGASLCLSLRRACSRFNFGLRFRRDRVDT